MHYSTFLAAALSFGTTLGHAINGGKALTTTKGSCSVQMGTKSVKHVPTRLSTTTQNLAPLTVTSTTRSTVKVTPQPKTVTITKYAITRTTTTLKAITKGYTLTETETATSTLYDVQIETETITATDTVTEALPTLPTVTVTARGELEKRHDGYRVKQYPQFKQCKIILQIRKITTVVAQAPARTITLPPRISLAIKTATLTKTRVQLIGKVTSTVTMTSTTTITTVLPSTSKTTTTTTTTVTVAPEPTCAAEGQACSAAPVGPECCSTLSCLSGLCQQCAPVGGHCTIDDFVQACCKGLDGSVGCYFPTGDPQNGECFI